MCFKTKFLLISFCFVTMYSFCQNTFIPDDNFEQALIDLGLDTGPLDNFVPTANINTVTNIDLSQKNISDITGIEDFAALTILNCSNNNLITLNVSNNTNLSELYCFNNILTLVNTNTLSNLVRFWCHNNQLTAINISQSNGLISLRCEENNITTLNIINTPNLRVLSCQSNQIRALNTTNNIQLDRLECGNNLISALDFTTNSNLTFLSIEKNQLTEIDLSNNPLIRFFFCFENELTDLDLSKNVNLEDLNCSSNKLCSLNVKNGNNRNTNSFNFSLNPDLNCVVVDNPDINTNSTFWIPTTFSNYARTQSLCGNFIPLDRLENFIGVNYTLPSLTNGNYFTGPNGTGTPLNQGTIITTSQTIYIFNEVGCIKANSSFNITIETRVFFIPKFFTPNNDGRNDFWNIIDNNNNINNVSIYNRHGKLLKYLSNNNLSWDGTFNGAFLNSDSYWYIIILNTQDVIKGHFALKR